MLYMTNKDYNYSTKDVAEALKISRQTTSRNLKPLIKYGLITETRIVDKTRMYAFNPCLFTTEYLTAFNNSIIEYMMQNFDIEPPEPSGVFIGKCEKCGEDWAVDLKETAAQAENDQIVLCPNCHHWGPTAKVVLKMAVMRSISRGIYRRM